MNGRSIAAIAITLGIPTLLLSYLAYRRALDFTIQSRNYIRAMNAIRNFFVTNDPSIAGAVLLPTDPRQPRFDRIGHGGTPIQGLATQMLILFALLSGAMTAATVWLLLAFLRGKVHVDLAWTAVPVAVIAVVAVGLVESRRMRRMLIEAETAAGGSTRF